MLNFQVTYDCRSKVISNLYRGSKSKVAPILMKHIQMWNDLWPIILCNLKTKHRRCIKLYIFWILMTRQTIWHCFQRNRSMFRFLTHVELSRSMAAILERPQYVAYQKNVVYTFIKLSAKSHSFNILCIMDGLSCPTILINSNKVVRSVKKS